MQEILNIRILIFSQSSFGLSVSSSGTIAYAGFETMCTEDYLVISSAGTEETQTSKQFENNLCIVFEKWSYSRINSYKL